ncbi:testis-specific Y-encoded-like protein 2 [Rhynchonycteris naso]
MDRPDEGPPAKTRRLSSSEPPQDDVPPPPPPLLRLPLPPPEQRPRLREETEAAQVLADMRGVGLGPTLPPPPPYIILEEGGVRAYFTLGAGCSCWESEIESGFGGAPPPTESLETLSPSEVSGESVEIDIQVTEPSSFDGEKALETCSIGGRGYQMLAGLQGKEEAIILVEDDDVDEKESVRKRRRRKRRQRKVKKESKAMNAEKIEYVLQALENIQLDLEAVNIKAGKAFLRLKRKFIQMRRPFLERRDLIIQHIPGFWVKAFLNHPKISILINQRDEDIFRYLTNLQVQDLRHISMGYKMKLYFQTNPYFTNMVIVKEFQCNRSGRLVSHSTPIRWHRGQEPQAHRHKNQDTNHSFFSWFSNHSLPEADRIAEIIKNDLWVNPVRYYMMGEDGYKANGKKRGKKERLFHSKKRDKYEVVIMEDFDDYQIMEDIIGETSDSDVITDNETIYDVKISDFMETTDCFETTDNEITDIGESLCDNESPGHNETTDNNESADDSDDNTDGDNKNPKGCSFNNILDMCDSDNDGDNEASDDDDDSNEGDNEGSDDGNEGDNEGSDDDDRDIDDYKNGIKEPRKHQVNSNLDGYEDEVENIFEEESSVNEEGGEDSDDEDVTEDEEGIEDWEDSDMEEAFQVQNGWTNWGKRGKTG